ncbi:MAG TPA: pilus assembly protein PilM [Candidatus Paceibacterota bacterium]
MSSLLSNFSISRLFSSLFSKEESVAGIDIGSSAIKVVQLKKKKGRAVLETYGELALGPYAGLSIGQATNLSTEKTIQALKDLFREANVTTKIVALSLPLRSSLVKVIELPAYKEEQINYMVPIEARKHIPVPIAEINLDWWVIPHKDLQNPANENTSENITTTLSATGRSGQTEILLVAVHKSAVKKHQDIVNALGLDARTFEIETFSSIRSLLVRDVSAMALLDVGASTTKLTIVDYGVVRIAHVINRGAQDITVSISTSTNTDFATAERKKRKDGLVDIQGAGSILDYIFYEAETVIEEYQKKHARLVTKILCTGGGAVMHGFLDLAKHHFQADVSIGNPFVKTDTPAFLSRILHEAGPEFAIALGLAIHELGEL